MTRINSFLSVLLDDMRISWRFVAFLCTAVACGYLVVAVPKVGFSLVGIYLLTVWLVSVFERSKQ